MRLDHDYNYVKYMKKVQASVYKISDQPWYVLPAVNINKNLGIFFK